jgi:peroxiredoxin
VVLFFFQIECPICQYTVPFLDRLEQGYRGQPVAIVGVSQHASRDTEEFIKEYGLGLPILLDDPANYLVSNAYGLTHVPAVFLIAANGTIEVSSVGWSRREIDAINEKIAECLHTQPTAVFRAGEDVADFRPG